MAMKSKKEIQNLIKKNSSIKLDLGCGFNKQKGFVGMDIRAVEGVDIVHDVESVPYPLPDSCCSVVLASHLIEHICPKKVLRVFDEVWRITKVDGQFWVSLPYAGSQGFWQDPSHCHSFNEATPYYFDPEPETLGGAVNVLYNVYKPLPWKILKSVWSENGNLEIIFEKRSLR